MSQICALCDMFQPVVLVNKVNVMYCGNRQEEMFRLYSVVVAFGKVEVCSVSKCLVYCTYMGTDLIRILRPETNLSSFL